jgi:hypothetical protein
MSDATATEALLGRILKMLADLSLRVTELEVEAEMADAASRRHRSLSNTLFELTQVHGQRIDIVDRKVFDGDTLNAAEIAMLRADLGYGPPSPEPPQRPKPRLVIDNTPPEGGPYVTS